MITVSVSTWAELLERQGGATGRLGGLLPLMTAKLHDST
jgi:hypothetical protein